MQALRISHKWIITDCGSNASVLRHNKRNFGKITRFLVSERFEGLMRKPSEGVQIAMEPEDILLEDERIQRPIPKKLRHGKRRRGSDGFRKKLSLSAGSDPTELLESSGYAAPAPHYVTEFGMDYPLSSHINNNTKGDISEVIEGCLGIVAKDWGELRCYSTAEFSMTTESLDGTTTYVYADNTQYNNYYQYSGNVHSPTQSYMLHHGSQSPVSVEDDNSSGLGAATRASPATVSDF
ncbi:hypothetical protein OSTOST_08732 [Ostertagia ostertagi]